MLVPPLPARLPLLPSLLACLPACLPCAALCYSCAIRSLKKKAGASVRCNRGWHPWSRPPCFPRRRLPPMPVPFHPHALPLIGFMVHAPPHHTFTPHLLCASPSSNPTVLLSALPS